MPQGKPQQASALVAAHGRRLPRARQVRRPRVRRREGQRRRAPRPRRIRRSRSGMAPRRSPPRTRRPRPPSRAKPLRQEQEVGRAGCGRGIPRSVTSGGVPPAGTRRGGAWSPASSLVPRRVRWPAARRAGTRRVPSRRDARTPTRARHRRPPTRARREPPKARPSAVGRAPDHGGARRRRRSRRSDRRNRARVPTRQIPAGLRGEAEGVRGRAEGSPARRHPQGRDARSPSARGGRRRRPTRASTPP